MFRKKLYSFLKNGKAKNSFFFIALNLLNASIPFLILPFLLSYLSPREIGILGIFNILYSFLQNVIGLGSFTQIQKEYIEKNNEKFSKYLLNSYFLSFLFVIFLNIITFLIPNSLIDGTLSRDIILITINGSFLFKLTNSSLLIIQQKKEVKIYAFLIIITTLTNFILSLLLLKNNFGVVGRILGIILAQLLLLVIIRLFNVDKLKFQLIKFNQLFSRFRHTIGFIPFQIGNWANKNLHKLVVLNFSSLEVFGAYTLGGSLSRIVSLPISSTIQGLKPYNNEDLKDGRFMDIVKTSNYIIFFAILVFVVVILFLDNLLIIVDRNQTYISYKLLFIIIFLSASLESIILYFKGIWVYMGRKKILNMQSFSHVFLALISIILQIQNIILYVTLSSVINLFLILHSRYKLYLIKHDS